MHIFCDFHLCFCKLHGVWYKLMKVQHVWHVLDLICLVELVEPPMNGHRFLWSPAVYSDICVARTMFTI